MRLSKIVQKKKLVILGLNSGTSMDGVDMAALSFNHQGDNLKSKYLAGRIRRFDPIMRDRLMKIADSRVIALEELILVDNALGIFFGRAARSFTSSLARRGIRVDAVASHGQTVRHAPEPQSFGKYRLNGTLQLGSLEQISASVGLPVAGDFRQAAIALKGEGAPITVDAVRQLLSDKAESRLIVNIGGMSNYFYLPATSSDRKARAADCGAGNVLSDLLCREFYGEPFDRNGRHAANGKVSHPLLEKLCGLPFFKKSSGSTGREEFGPDLVARIITDAGKSRITPDDMLATAVELTVESIIRVTLSIRRMDSSLTKLYLTGGGSRNKFLVRRLQQRLDGSAVRNVSELGFDPDLLEAASYALLGYRTLSGMPTRDWTRASGKRGLQPVMGKIVQPPCKVGKC